MSEVSLETGMYMLTEVNGVEELGRWMWKVSILPAALSVDMPSCLVYGRRDL